MRKRRCWDDCVYNIEDERKVSRGLQEKKKDKKLDEIEGSLTNQR